MLKLVSLEGLEAVRDKHAAACTASVSGPDRPTLHASWCSIKLSTLQTINSHIRKKTVRKNPSLPFETQPASSDPSLILMHTYIKDTQKRTKKVDIKRCLEKKSSQEVGVRFQFH